MYNLKTTNTNISYYIGKSAKILKGFSDFLSKSLFACFIQQASTKKECSCYFKNNLFSMQSQENKISVK